LEEVAAMDVAELIAKDVAELTAEEVERIHLELWRVECALDFVRPEGEAIDGVAGLFWKLSPVQSIPASREKAFGDGVLVIPGVAFDCWCDWCGGDVERWEKGFTGGGWTLDAFYGVAQKAGWRKDTPWQAAARRAVKAAMSDMRHECHEWESEEKRQFADELIVGLRRYGFEIVERRCLLQMAEGECWLSDDPEPDGIVLIAEGGGRKRRQLSEERLRERSWRRQR
jgi:hypothetical protein